MPEKSFERRPILDPIVADLLAGMEQKQAEAQLPRRQREKKIRERQKIRARRDQRATYDLPPFLRQRVKSLAEEHSVPASQLVTLALLQFFEAYDQGQVDLSELKQPSRSPRYDWNLVFPDKWIKPEERKRSKKA
ncbi:hypothetical protein ADN00_05405 [Ornatilinea apprima]|uniref:Uncharacterized protein n=1 Tax=Ornatilinea apprima TaxID=1134406 RepID=A0A0P6XES7_9CHLR|nr:hypothetical protein [Ornatilinea apprima]KPL78687.1 hypothetical protein ADN00_05405 [Ornatilinea apprima]